MNLGEFFTKAQKEGFAIGAFNVSDLAMIKAVVAAGGKLSSPVILETSPSESQFIGWRNLASIAQNFHKESGLPIFINLDHSTSLQGIGEAVKDGYDLVHFDGSGLDIGENLNKAFNAVAWAHSSGALLEVEIDRITGQSHYHSQMVESTQAAGVYTDPDVAARFIKESGADILAAFVGNVHGVYKNPIKLDLKRLRLIAEKVGCFLSLHGGSGIEEREIKKAIKVGKIVKINVSTELRLAYRNALEKSLADLGSEEVAPYKIMEPVISAVQKVVEEKIRIFGSEGRAG